MTCAGCETCGDAPEGAECRHELHVTVHRPRGIWTRDFVGVVRSLGLDPVVMTTLLRDGRRATEFMTRSSLVGSDAAARRELARVGEALAEAGYDPVRVKIEAVPWHPRAPQDSGAPPQGCYWESHVTGWLEEARTPELDTLLRGRGCYLSYNELAEARPGRRRFSVTIRSRTNSRRTQEVAGYMVMDLVRSRGAEVDSRLRTEFAWLDESYAALTPEGTTAGMLDYAA